MKMNSGNPRQTELEGDDVVIILRPNKVEGKWDGTYDIIQSVVEPTTLSPEDAYNVAFTGLLMALLPTYLVDDESFNEHYLDFIHDDNEDLVLELLDRHGLLSDAMASIMKGKMH
jgi:hypothetical protein